MVVLVTTRSVGTRLAEATFEHDVSPRHPRDFHQVTRVEIYRRSVGVVDTLGRVVALRVLAAAGCGCLPVASSAKQERNQI